MMPGVAHTTSLAHACMKLLQRFKKNVRHAFARRRTDSSIPVGFDITDRATLGASLIPATFAGALNSLVGDAARARVGCTQ